MKKLVCFLAVMFLMTGIAAAQDFPKAEIFGGYSVMHISGEMVESGHELWKDIDKDGGSKWFAKGFDVSATYNINQYFGVEAAFGLNAGTLKDKNGSKETAKDISFLVGPRVAYRTERITPFAHFLLGVDRVSESDTYKDYPAYNKDYSDAGFAFGFGGGVDVNITNKWAVRPIQLDWVHTKHNFDPKDDPDDEFSMNNLKLSFGVVYRF